MQTTIRPNANHHYYFVTGKLAERALREIVSELAVVHGFQYTIGVMPITVAALITPRWLKRHIDVPSTATHVILPGYVSSDPADPHWEDLSGHAQIPAINVPAIYVPAINVPEIKIPEIKVPVILGPKDCRDMATLFGADRASADLNQYDIEILAEINHAPRRTVSEVVAEAKMLTEQGADVIDFGCDPASPCVKIGDYVMALVDQGLRVSVDSFDPFEVAAATRHGAELVLSVNSKNREAAVDWECEVVVVPDSSTDQLSFHETIEYLDRAGVPMRLDPILEPIGVGLAASLVRYADTRRRYPRQPIMMGIGNLTELTDVDSAGINFLLLGICQELGIQSVLTTQVINWARTSVTECDLARRMVHYSQKHGVPPKRLSDQLVMLRDPRLKQFSTQTLDLLAKSIRDNNYRVHVDEDLIHLISAGMHLADRDPFAIFEQLMQQDQAKNVDPNHAFYLGYEIAKASIALQLGKQYEQDESLHWGYLTEKQANHRLKRR